MRDLLVPAAYPARPSDVALVETHISWIFLAGNDVYKVKKPVRFSFLDFGTLELRRHFCDEEVRLNRRLAPDVYRGVVPIVREGGGHRVGGGGAPVEWAVHMRRLPAARSLRALVERGEADAALMERIAGTMARFHASAPLVPHASTAGTPPDLADVFRRNFAALAPHADALGRRMTAETVERLLLRALARSAGRLRARRRAGRVRECHGDLRPDHVYVEATLAIIDCIEFDVRLRHGDVASEIGFLSMELEARGAADLGRHLERAYARAADDADLPAVLPLFRAYRAHVRAMVAVLTAAETDDPPTRAGLHGEARAYLDLALRDAWTANAPVVVAVAGGSGTGKSTLARAIADATGAAWLRSDVLRKVRAGMAPLDRPSDSEAETLYSAGRSDDTYAALAGDAAARADHGGIVVVDATFLRRSERAHLAACVAAVGVPLRWIECRAAPAIVRGRLDARAQRGDDPSDATWEIAQAQARRREPLDEIDVADRLALATDDPALDPTATALAWLAGTLPA